MDSNPPPIDSTGGDQLCFFRCVFRSSCDKAQRQPIGYVPSNRKVIPAQNLCNGRQGRLSFGLGRAVEVAAPFFNGAVQHVCETTALSDHSTGVGEKDFSWQGVFSDISLKLRSPRAWVRFHFVAISQHIARDRVTLLGLFSRDSRMRSAARCHLVRLRHFPDPGAPMMPGSCGDSLQLASIDVLESMIARCICQCRRGVSLPHKR
jgi:hypothetical protein